MTVDEILRLTGDEIARMSRRELTRVTKVLADAGNKRLKRLSTFSAQQESMAYADAMESGGKFIAMGFCGIGFRPHQPEETLLMMLSPSLLREVICQVLSNYFATLPTIAH